tara:strand:- start:343 stop:747 length:405 start_codon:yes stop_codon:yes gene_type:complete
MLDTFVKDKWNRRIVDVSVMPGSCQFEAIGDQLGISGVAVRNSAVTYIKNNKDRYDGLLLPTPDAYLFKMSQNTTWGDHITLDAIANAHETNIFVAAAFQVETIIEVKPVSETVNTIYVGAYPENHYVSTAPIN